VCANSCVETGKIRVGYGRSKWHVTGVPLSNIAAETSHLSRCGLKINVYIHLKMGGNTNERFLRFFFKSGFPEEDEISYFCI